MPVRDRAVVAGRRGNRLHPTVIVPGFPLGPWSPSSGVLQHVLEVVTWIVLNPVVLEACSRTGTRDGQVGRTLIVPFAPPFAPPSDSLVLKLRGELDRERTTSPLMDERSLYDLPPGLAR